MVVNESQRQPSEDESSSGPQPLRASQSFSEICRVDDFSHTPSPHGDDFGRQPEPLLPHTPHREGGTLRLPTRVQVEHLFKHQRDAIQWCMHTEAYGADNGFVSALHMPTFLNHSKPPGEGDPPVTLHFNGVSLSWGLESHRVRGGIIADEMGGGKTPLAIALVAAGCTPSRRTMIVCPKSLVHQWKMEWDRFAPRSAPPGPRSRSARSW